MIENFNLAFLGVEKNIFIYRDDLFPHYYGGNKARKILLEKENIISKRSGAVITTGGIQSNHCRVTALLCAELGVECHLVLHGSEVDFYSEKGNASIMRMSGAKLYFVQSNTISVTMNFLMKNLSEAGKSPYYLYGGGHTKFGVEAYRKATINLLNSDDFKKNRIKHIFLASGTGSTQAGILQGIEECNSSINVIGISIARNADRSIEAVNESLSFLKDSTSTLNRKITVLDDYLLDGYGSSNNELNDFLKLVIKNTGVIFDSTYTGKALFGMIEEIKKPNKYAENILFWHTGGQFNSLA